MIYIPFILFILFYLNLNLEIDYLICGSTLSSGLLEKIIMGLWTEFSKTNDPAKRSEIYKEIKIRTRELEAEMTAHEKKAKAFFTLEERRAKRAAKLAEKKAALQQFFNNSDLYSTACAILGFDIKQKLKSIALNSKWVTVKNHPIKDPASFTMDFHTFDVEAYQNEAGEFIPYQFGFYSPDLGYKSFYGKDCMADGVKFILHHNYSSAEVTYYAHNFGKFDALFLIKALNNHSIENIRVLRDKQNSIFYISFNYNGYLFHFKDSFKLMPHGLDKLLKDFNIDVGGLTGKLPFDHSWINSSNLNYVGTIPSWLSYMEKELKSLGVIQNNEFSIERYCYEYNKVDNIGLHKLIYKFFYTLVEEFKIDFSHCITLPQLSLEVFRSKFLKNNKTIRLLSTHHYNFIKQAFYGSNVSVYKPFGENLYAYDINSLYPYCMLKDLPVSTPKPYDVSKGLENFFGFAYCEVTAPSDLKIPVLPLKAMINGSEKLIFPTGTFRSTYFSEELKYAKELGYSIKLIRAYSFNRSNDLFTEFVHNFYDKKLNGNGAIKAISKLMLNSLYGRFAMSKDFSYDLITSSDAVKNKVLNLFSNISPEPLDEKSVLFNFSVAPNPNLKDPYVVELLNKMFNKSREARIGNIAIAAAITAYARIEIDRYKRLPNITCYYTDTDSVFLDAELPKKYLGDKIGHTTISYFKT
jgi:hypothetical protein